MQDKFDEFVSSDIENEKYEQVNEPLARKRRTHRFYWLSVMLTLLGTALLASIATMCHNNNTKLTRLLGKHADTANNAQSLRHPPHFTQLPSFGVDDELNFRGPTTGHTCPIDIPATCSNETVQEDLCCFNYPGGLLLQTQFWDAHPPIGPDDLFTAHGLWPDKCDGSFEEFCDKSREVPSIKQELLSAGRSDLVDKMTEIWKSNNGLDDRFWTHEWNKHGTCISTLNSECYPASTQPLTDAIIDYFTKAIALFESLDTFQILADSGIVPSTTATYTFDEIINAIQAKTGQEPVIRCRSGYLNEVWYFFHVIGPVQFGKYIPTGPDGAKSNCPNTGIKFPPKSGKPPGNPGKPAPPSDPNDSFSGTGNIRVKDQPGCVISGGNWYASTGSCATYTATRQDDNVTLRSSKGNCGIVGGAFVCSSSIDIPDTFTVSKNGLLEHESSVDWFGSNVPSGIEQVTLYTKKRHADDVAVQLYWT
ncbi:hypothetical protein CANCADRAFT_30381 [Tortispora caseinolytica NRRL Y-17796]|uniref:ribonuclease T2 n=1 Tax=Tortispora caseinolytica NRRL Y-17796 TaxID=767744 RepID=A0A1E4TKD2_9ASCO|nr:hypothetical protein CANCADRAFT_30381 [Tortispora caseinolytica NRRL Y-17796]